MSNENVAINAFIAFLNFIIKGFEIYKTRIETKCADLKQQVEHFKGSDQEKQKKVNELEKAEEVHEAVKGALNYFNSLSDAAKAEIAFNTMHDITTDACALEKRWINEDGKLTPEGFKEFNVRIVDKAVDSQKGLDAEQKKSVRVQIQKLYETTSQILKENIHEVSTETYQKLSNIYKKSHNDDPTQYFSRNNIDAAIDNLIRNNGNHDTLKELFAIKDKLTKGEPVTYKSERVQSDLTPARAQDEQQH